MMYIYQEEYKCSKCSRVKHFASADQHEKHPEKEFHIEKALKKPCGWCKFNQNPLDSKLKDFSS